MPIYRLIAAEASYYSGKVRAYLRYKGVPFEELLATRKLYQELPVFQGGVRSIPVLLAPEGDALTDSTDIIDFCEARFPEPCVCPRTPLQRLVALFFEIYADEWLLLPAMHYRWSYREENYDFVVREFGATLLPDAPADEQRQAGEKAAAVFDPVLPLLGITARTKPAIEAWYEEFLDQMSAHLALHPFLLGSRPSLGDFALMGPLYAQLYRDPYPGRLMRTRAPRVAAWVERMNAPTARSGAFLPHDAVPDTVIAMMRRIFAEQLPVLLDTAGRVCDWIDTHPDTPLPRGIGFHTFTVGGVVERRAVVPYSLSMLQRVLDFRRSLDATARARVDRFLCAHGAEGVLSLEPRYRIRRERNVLTIDRSPPS